MGMIWAAVPAPSMRWIKAGGPSRAALAVYGRERL